MTKKLDRVVEAISYIDNEAIRLRDESKQNPEAEAKKKEIYSIKDDVMKQLYSQNLLNTVGYMEQTIPNNPKCKNKIYKNIINGTAIYSVKPYIKRGESIAGEGEIGLMAFAEMDTDLTMEKAIEIIRDYISGDKKAESEAAEEKGVEEKDADGSIGYSIKETKLVEVSKLKIVKDIHMNNNINQERKEQKKSELVEKIEKNKGRYPKDEALLVFKSKDPDDRRRVVYNLEDGFRRLVIAQELGLEKVYVDIIDSDI